MASSSKHQFFTSSGRVSQSLRSDRCQTILYEAVFEHFKELKDIAVLLLTSKSFQNSSFGANFLVNYVIDEKTIHLIDSVLSPSSCFSLQFAPSLRIKHWETGSEKNNRGISNFVRELVDTKYLHLSLRSLTMDFVGSEVLSGLFGSSNDSWPQLLDLSMKECEVNDTAMENISKTAVQLRSVNLTSNWGITDIGLEHLSKLSGITTLHLFCCFEITDIGLHFVSQLFGIKSLNLSFCRQITDAGLKTLSQLCGVTSLNLSNCFRITDVGLEHISKLTRITSLNLNSCGSITDFGLEHVAKLSRITSLDLYSCNLVTDAGLECLSKLAGITFLNLNGCNLVTDTGLQQVCKLSSMTSLDLSLCSKITDDGLEYLAQLSRITSLDLSCCGRITDAGLDHVFGLTSLTSLMLTRCNKITNEATKKLKAALPNCSIFA